MLMEVSGSDESKISFGNLLLLNLLMKVSEPSGLEEEENRRLFDFLRVEDPKQEKSLRLFDFLRPVRSKAGEDLQIFDRTLQSYSTFRGPKAICTVHAVHCMSNWFFSGSPVLMPGNKPSRYPALPDERPGSPPPAGSGHRTAGL